MEFSLTFLAMDRLGYGPRQNAFIFLFVGIVLVLVQGGYVRRQSAKIGPKRMCIQGLALVAPGLVVIGYAHSAPVLYAGLFLLAVGSGQVIPCLTALASIYTPPEEQGRVLGVFRSLGALGRGLGPLIACLLYWRLGATPMYWLGAIAILVPLALAVSLPEPKEE
jgi:MFS family permease